MGTAEDPKQIPPASRQLPRLIRQDLNRILPSMEVSEIVQSLASLLPDFRERKPEEVLLKFASERDVAPAVLEKLAQIYNNARTVHVMENGRDGRGSSFQLLDVPGLVGRYEGQKTAAAQKIQDGRELLLGLIRNSSAPLRKSADTQLREAFGFAFDGEEDLAPLVRKVASSMKTLEPREEEPPHQDWLEKEAQEAGAVAVGAEKQARLLAEEIGVGLNRISTGHDLLAADVQHLLGDGMAKLAFDGLRRFGVVLPATQKQARAYPTDRTGLIPRVEAFCDHLLTETAAREIQVEKRQEAKAAAAPPPTLPPPTRTYDEADLALDESETAEDDFAELTEQEKVLQAELEELLKRQAPETELSAQDPFVRIVQERMARSPGEMSQFGDMGFGAVGDNVRGVEGVASRFAKPEKKRQKVLEAVADDRMRSNIQRLRITDPVVAEADPTTVEQILETILTGDPTIAQNYMLLRGAVREAIQYEAVPGATYKGMVEGRKIRSEGLKQEIESARGAPSRPAPASASKPTR